jgi:hypothetical protein
MKNGRATEYESMSVIRNTKFEPSLLPIMEEQSGVMGCKGGRRRNVSEFLRRAAKTVILKNCPSLRKAHEKIDWSEAYK